MNVGIILAAGQGQRLQATQPKQFLEINGVPLLVYTLKQFDECLDIDAIAIAVPNKCQKDVAEMIDKYNLSKIKWLIVGGNSRQESVWKSLSFLADKIKSNDLILIHDGARPLISKEMISKSIKMMQQHDAVSLCHKVTDTTVDVDNEKKISKFHNRNYLYAIETPQTFRFELIYQAHQQAIANNFFDAGDDAILVDRCNLPVYLLENQTPNFKVTTSADMDIVRILLEKKLFNF